MSVHDDFDTSLDKENVQEFSPKNHSTPPHSPLLVVFADEMEIKNWKREKEMDPVATALGRSRRVISRNNDVDTEIEVQKSTTTTAKRSKIQRLETIYHGNCTNTICKYFIQKKDKHL